MAKIKLIAGSALGLGAVTSVQADVIDDTAKVLREKGINVKIEENKVQVYSHDELERKQKNEEENRKGEADRAKNVFAKYLQQNRQVDHVSENNTRNNVAINRSNDAIKAENERLFKNWEEDVLRVKEHNKKLTDKYESEKKEIEETNATLTEEYNAVVAKMNRDGKDSSSDIAEQIKKIKETNARIEKENADRRAQVDKENARRKEVNANNARLVNNYKNDLAKYVAEKAKIEKENQEARNRNAQRQAEFEKTSAKVNSDYEKALAKYNQDKAEYDKAKSKYDQDKSKYDQEKSKYDKENSKYANDKGQYDKDIAKYNQDKAKYDQDKAKYDRDKAQYDNDKSQYDSDLAEYNRAKARYDTEYADWLANKDRPSTTTITSSNAAEVRNAVNNNGGVDENREFISDVWNNRRPVTVGGDIRVAGTGDVTNGSDLSNGSYTINAYSESGKLRNDNVIVGIEWTNGQRLQPYQNGVIYDGDMIQKSYTAITGRTNSLYDTQSGGTTVVQSVKSGQWFLVPNAVRLKDGTTRGLWVRLTKSGDRLRYGGDWFTVWNANGAINYYNGANPIGQHDADQVTVEYEVEDSREYLWTAAMIDLDGGQYAKMSHGGRIIGNGGGTSTDGYTAWSNENLGFNFGKNHSYGQALDGLRSAPDGVFTYAGFGKRIGYTIANTKGGRSTAIANGDFGTRINVNIVTTETITVTNPNTPKPTPPTPPSKPTAPIAPVEPNKPGAPTAPIAPTPPNAPIAPNKPKDKPEVKKPEVELEKPLPKEPTEPKVKDLPPVVPMDTPLLIPPTDTTKPPFKPNLNLLPIPKKPELKPEPVKPKPLDGIPETPKPNADGAHKPSIVLKRTIFEYLNTSTGIGSNVRKLGKASFGNSTQVRVLSGNKLSFGNSFKVDKL